ncbi:uncharacterized protein J3D65DRAFT_23613 [Phyllosticta citribraziliensis]|uniref:Secreted protein n=1 Tax=Phyllosticta citribraziliensis TaxID=989973 RepID=A0ABR1MBB2_9PEZI
MIPCFVSRPVGVWHCLFSLFSPSSRPAFSLSPPIHQPTIHLPMCLSHHTVTHVAIPSSSFSSSSHRIPEKKSKDRFLRWLLEHLACLLAFNPRHQRNTLIHMHSQNPNHCFLFTCPPQSFTTADGRRVRQTIDKRMELALTSGLVLSFPRRNCGGE